MNRLTISTLWIITAVPLITALANDTENLGVTDNPGHEISPPNTYLSDKFFEKALTYISNSPAFNKYTKEQLRNLLSDLETWVPPERFSKNFPYYLAGYDSEDRPVWISEVGKYDLRSEVERGPENVQILVKFMIQANYNIIKSIYDKDTPEREVRHAVFISDMDGFDMRQYSHADTIALCLQFARDYKEVTEELMGKWILINVSHIARVALGIFKPILGRLTERIDVYGTNKASWVPKLRRVLPDEIIPPWYGGNKNFKALQVYG